MGVCACVHTHVHNNSFSESKKKKKKAHNNLSYLQIKKEFGMTGTPQRVMRSRNSLFDNMAASP